MRLETVLVGDHNQATKEAFGSARLAARFLDEIIGDHFCVKNARERPAEYHVQKPLFAVSLDGTGMLGVKVCLFGVSREDHSPKFFHEVIKTLSRIVVETIRETASDGAGIQISCTMMLDASVENWPGSGRYTSMIEGSNIVVSM